VVDGIMKEIQMREGIKRRGLTFKLITIVTFGCDSDTKFRPVRIFSKGLTTFE